MVDTIGIYPTKSKGGEGVLTFLKERLMNIDWERREDDKQDQKVEIQRVLGTLFRFRKVMNENSSDKAEQCQDSNFGRVLHDYKQMKS